MRFLYFGRCCNRWEFWGSWVGVSAFSCGPDMNLRGQRSDYDRLHNELPKMSMSWSLEPVNMLPYMTKGASQIWLSLKSWNGERYYSGLSGGAQHNHKGPYNWKMEAEIQCQSDVAWERLDQSLLALKMGGGDHKPRTASSLQKLEEAGKWILPKWLQKEGRPAGI